MRPRLLIEKFNRKLVQVQENIELFEGIWNFSVISKIKTPWPREILLNLTYRCNSKCTMCHIWQCKVEKEMGLDDWKKVVDDPIFNEIRDLTISGGEAMLHPEFNAIAELLVIGLPKIKKLGLISNGFLTEEIIKKVELLAVACKKNRVVLSVTISLDGVGKVHETVRRIKDGFKRTSTTIVKLQELQKRMNNSFNLNVSTVILKQNLDNFDETKDWLEKMKLSYGFQIVGFHKTFVNNLNTRNEVDFREEDKEKLKMVLEKLKKFDGFKSYYWADLWDMYIKGLPRTTPCPMAVDQLVIDGTGEVFYCLSEKSIGNFLRENRTIADIYFDKNNLKIRKQRWQTVCKTCNSGCNAKAAIAYDVKKYLWYRITGNVWLR